MTALDSDRLLELTSAAVRAARDAGCDDAEALLFHESTGLTRFADNRIHQSTRRQDVEVRVRVVTDGNRVGVASTHDATAEGARDAAERAQKIARAMPPDPTYPGMPGAASYAQAGTPDAATAAATPDERAALVAKVVHALPAGVRAAGALETGASGLAIANSRGVEGAFTVTQASFSILADAGSGTGYASAAEPSLAALSTSALGERAARKAVDSRDPRDLEPGAYPVVLEPAAAATLVEFLGFLGFGARAYDEGRSFLTGKLGQKLCDASVTIVDDGLAADTVGAPFDFEGVPKRPVTLIDKGMAASLLYDWRSAVEHGVQATGHGLPAPSSEGAFPLHLAMRPGDATLPGMIAEMERGLLVTRFHYTNVVNEMDTTLTGMTRDGTFWIENGQITGPVKNLRFTQSILGALSGVRAISRDTELLAEEFIGTTRVPAVSLDSFNFSSATTF